jgi:DNA-3-methyladenine glycosylase II
MINLDEAILHLQSDHIMAQLIEHHNLPTWRNPNDINVFADVVGSIISQQLSVKVADVIEARVYALMPNNQPSPEAIMVLDPELIRACGVSYAKIRYLKAAAEAALSGQVNFNTLHEKTDEEVISDLVSIHGIGRWTAEMLLISSLHRPDIFSLGDLGLRTAVSRLYGVERSDLNAITEVSQQWSPYRSIASKYLWKSLDNEPLNKSSTA